MDGLAVLETHPIQYHAPVYRALERRFGIPVTAVYASDASILGYHDAEFGETFAWDTDLLSGYDSVVLSGATSTTRDVQTPVRTGRLRDALRRIDPSAILLVGYSPRFHQQAFLAALMAR